MECLLNSLQILNIIFDRRLPIHSTHVQRTNRPKLSTPRGKDRHAKRSTSWKQKRKTWSKFQKTKASITPQISFQKGGIVASH